MLKFRTVMLFVLIVVINVSFAEVITLWSISDDTYVTSEHGDEYFADTYYGEVSIRGADRYIDEDDGKTRYVKWVKIIYNVQGDIYTKTVYSFGKHDQKTRKAYITVKDKWNFGPKTIVGYDFASGVAYNKHHNGEVNDSLYYDDDEKITSGRMIIE